MNVHLANYLASDRPRDAVASMIKRLAHRNANVQLYTMEVGNSLKGLGTEADTYRDCSWRMHSYRIVVQRCIGNWLLEVLRTPF